MTWQKRNVLAMNDRRRKKSPDASCVDREILMHHALCRERVVQALCALWTLRTDTLAMTMFPPSRRSGLVSQETVRPRRRVAGNAPTLQSQTGHSIGTDSSGRSEDPQHATLHTRRAMKHFNVVSVPQAVVTHRP